MTKARAVVCYTFEDTYLVPTLISARSFRQFVGPDEADIVLFAVDCDPALLEMARPVIADMQAELVILPSESLDHFRSRFEDARYYKISVLARLVLADHLPRDYDRIIYIDGDTLVVGDPRFLLKRPLPPNKVMVTVDGDDAVSRGNNPFAPEMVERFRLLGLDENDVYVNTGVMVARLDAWRAAMADAADYYLDNYRLCKFFDQCAINATLGERRLFMSPAYNFQPSFTRWGVDREITPVIAHYAGALKPWHTPQWPFREHHRRWQSAIDDLGELGRDFRSRYEPARHWRVKEMADRLRDLRFRLRYRGETERFRDHCLLIDKRSTGERREGRPDLLPSPRPLRTPAEDRGRLAQR